MARLALSGDSGVGEKWTHSNKIQEVKMTGFIEELPPRTIPRVWWWHPLLSLGQ